MAPRRSLAVQTAAPYTKGEVNRAGELLLDLRERMRHEGPDRALADSDEAKLDRARDALTWWRGLHARPLSSVAANLRYHVDQEGGRIQGRIEVTQRLKRLVTLIDKLGREQGNVTQMHDIGGVRALLPSLAHVYSLSRRLRKTWTIIKVRDYVAEPKPSGYRALHLIVRRKGRAIEVQLRTVVQDIWANVVEDQGRELGVGFKFGEGTPTLRAYFVKMSDAMALFDRGEMSEQDLRRTLGTMR